MAQLLRPDSNVTQTDFTGGFAEIDESVASDADKAFGANNTAAVLEVGLGNPTGTPGSGAVTFRYRHAKVNNGTIDGGGNAVTVTAEVVEGTTVRATDAAQTSTGTVQQREWNPDLSAVTNWNDLRLRFTTSASGGSPANRRGAAITWAELEVPDAASAQSLTLPLTTNSQSFHSPRLDLVLNPPALANAQSFFSPTVSPGPVSLTLSAFANSQSFFGPRLDLVLSLGALNNSQVFHAPRLDLNLTLPLLANTQSFPTISVQHQGMIEIPLTLPLLVNAQAFFRPTIWACTGVQAVTWTPITSDPETWA